MDPFTFAPIKVQTPEESSPDPPNLFEATFNRLDPQHLPRILCIALVWRAKKATERLPPICVK